MTKPDENYKDQTPRVDRLVVPATAPKHGQYCMAPYGLWTMIDGAQAAIYRMLDSQVALGNNFQRVLDDNRWGLYEA